MSTFFTREFHSEDNRKEVYVYYRGRLIYKAWYVASHKQYSKLFHEGEGLTQEVKSGRGN